MPSRVLREGWVDSETIAKLSAEAERFALRLLLRADDFGRMTANSGLLRSSLFPLAEDVTRERVEGWLAECAAVGFLRCYAVSATGVSRWCEPDESLAPDEKKHLVIPKFNQRLRSHRGKFPAPPLAELSADHSPQSAPIRPADDRHMPDNCRTSDGHMPVNCPTSGSNPPPDLDLDLDSDLDKLATLAAGKREALRTFPPSLAGPEFPAIWERWLTHWAKSFKGGKPMPHATADSQLRKLAELGLPRAITAIENAIARGFREPAEPFSGKSRPARRASFA